MILTELGAVASAALPLAAFRGHLRLPLAAEAGPGDSEEAQALETALRAALAAIESRTAKVLMGRPFRLTLAHWRDGAAQPLPVAPVSDIVAMVLRAADGTATTVAADRYHLEQDQHRPRLVARGMLLPAIPRGGRAEIDFTAGFGPDWGDLPEDLARAAFLLGAQYFEERHAGAGHGVGAGLAFGVEALIARWRTVRLLGGAGQ